MLTSKQNKNIGDGYRYLVYTEHFFDTFSKVCTKNLGHGSDIQHYVHSSLRRHIIFGNSGAIEGTLPSLPFT